MFRLFWRDGAQYSKVPMWARLLLAAITIVAITVAQGVVWAIGVVIAGLGAGFIVRAVMARRGDS